jgi:hypothetical protein
MHSASIDPTRLVTPQILRKFPDARFKVLESCISPEVTSAGIERLVYFRKVAFLIAQYHTPFLAEARLPLVSAQARAIYELIATSGEPMGAVLARTFRPSDVRIDIVREVKRPGAGRESDFFGGYVLIERVIQVADVNISLTELPPDGQAMDLRQEA